MLIPIGETVLHQFVVSTSNLAAAATRDRDTSGRLMYQPQGFQTLGGFVRPLDGDILQPFGIGLQVDRLSILSANHYLDNFQFTVNDTSRQFKNFTKNDDSVFDEDYKVFITNGGAGASDTNEKRLELNFFIRRLF